jgi:hypothetical protein
MSAHQRSSQRLGNELEQHAYQDRTDEDQYDIEKKPDQKRDQHNDRNNYRPLEEFEGSHPHSPACRDQTAQSRRPAASLQCLAASGNEPGQTLVPRVSGANRKWSRQSVFMVRHASGNTRGAREPAFQRKFIVMAGIISMELTGSRARRTRIAPYAGLR